MYEILQTADSVCSVKYGLPQWGELLVVDLQKKGTDVVSAGRLLCVKVSKSIGHLSH